MYATDVKPSSGVEPASARRMEAGCSRIEIDVRRVSRSPFVNCVAVAGLEARQQGLAQPGATVRVKDNGRQATRAGDPIKPGLGQARALSDRSGPLE